jgi:hypothetical protein
MMSVAEAKREFAAGNSEEMAGCLICLLNPDEWIAIGTMVNAVVVVALAIISYLYMKSAARQADAAEEQARASQAQASAAQEQAKIANDSLALLRIQIEEQSGLAFSRHVDTLRRIRGEARAWMDRLSVNWSNLPTSCSLLPASWSEASHWLPKRYPELTKTVDSIPEELEAANWIIQDIISTPSSGLLGKQAAMKNAVQHLSRASEAVTTILINCMLRKVHPAEPILLFRPFLGWRQKALKGRLLARMGFV